MDIIYSCKVDDSVIDRARYDADFYQKQNEQKYAKRNQFVAKKINEDMVSGLSFELSAGYNYLCEQVGEDNVEEPYVYDGNNEMKENFSHDADIVTHGKYNFHCKSITPYMANNYGYGWVFQKNYLDKNEEKLRNSDNDFVMFGTIDIVTKEAKILVLQKFSVLFENNMFEVPVKRNLREGKRIIKYSKFIEKDIPRKINLTDIINQYQKE